MSLKATHVASRDNIADALSRGDVEAFLRGFPTAATRFSIPVPQHLSDFIIPLYISPPSHTPIDAAVLRPPCRAEERIFRWTGVNIPPPSTINDPVLQVLANAASRASLKDASAYGAGLRKFHIFCDVFDIAEELRLPAPFHILHSFAIWAASDPDSINPNLGSIRHFEPVAVPTVRKYLSAVRAWHIVQGWPEPLTPSDSTRIEWSLRGLEKIMPRRKRPPRPPVTIKLLRIMRSALNLEDSFDACIWAMATCAFWGIMRFGEVSYPSSRSFDGSKHLKRSDITFDADGNGVPYARLDLPCAKTAKPGEIQKVFIATQEPDVCALEALANLAKIVPAEREDPLFSWIDRFGKVRPMAKDAALKKINTISREAGLEGGPGDISSWSSINIQAIYRVVRVDWAGVSLSRSALDGPTLSLTDPVSCSRVSADEAGRTGAWQLTTYSLVPNAPGSVPSFSCSLSTPPVPSSARRRTRHPVFIRYTDRLPRRYLSYTHQSKRIAGLTGTLIAPLVPGSISSSEFGTWTNLGAARHLHWQDIIDYNHGRGSGDEMIALVSVGAGHNNRPSTATVRELNVDGIDKDVEEKSIGDNVRSASHSDLYTLSDRGGSFFGTYDPNYDSQSDVLEEEDSPYPEVRSAVANFDDPSMPVSTLRAWVLGVVWAILIPGMNQFFYLRYPSVAIGGLVAQLLVFPVGRAWVRFMPCKTIFGLEINPGPFTIKEHVLVTIMASVGAQTAYATDIFAVQRVYYNQDWSFGYRWMLVMSTQLIGFSIGGIARRFLVAPPSMIWPNTLVSCALFNTLHSQSYAGIGRQEGISRERFFTYALTAAVVWYIVPGYLFEALSFFTWVCWIAPDNIKLNQIFGYKSGLGFSLLTFDWNQIAFTGSPLATPWWAEANVMIGFFVFFWFLTPVLYYSNVWDSQNMPIVSSDAYDNRGLKYNVTLIIDSNATLNLEAYKAYSPLYLPMAFAMSYGLSFLSITATISHAIIHFWKPIRLQFNRSLREQPDIHAQLMSRYPQVPEWYYACIFVVTFVFACICIRLWPTGMTVWALLIALLICEYLPCIAPEHYSYNGGDTLASPSSSAVVYVIPIGMIQAVTNRQVGLNVITELIVGYMMPGKPNAMMIFKTYGYITMSQAMQFTADFKLGHYMKIPPKSMFWSQVVATIIAGTVQLGVQAWMFANITDLCQSYQRDNFTCASTHVFGVASVIFGVIGPRLLFSSSQVYYAPSALSFFFLIGAICPVILWLITKRYPNTILRYLNFPLIFSGVGQIPPAAAVNYVPWAIVGFIFQYVVRRRHFSYWAKYNYVLSAALDAGTAIGVILVYFCLQYPFDGKTTLSSVRGWWGNTVHKNTSDWAYGALKNATTNPFGPTKW
ncbi:hypothetical protein NP233_g147 [Leucocoprinus birnbaumii]|uniref:Oligopeptide transporter n=1 Tax=Leucocoprinus birnbaumii TaxID=56174 RepID=A0AAD5W3C2_9AGAR|nr:hypothetical protein NP233_g147 [Leucocoprinus birnbaumii]